MRSGSTKATLIAVASLLSSAGVMGCSTSKLDSAKSQEERQTKGTLDLSLELAPGYVINTITYQITGPSLPPTGPWSGTINVSDADSTASALIGGLPAGSGYTVTLTANTIGTPSVPCAGTSAAFSITAGAPTFVAVALRCEAAPNTLGEASINATFSQCPTITSWVAAPLQVSTNGVIDVSATVTDPDGTGAHTYTWSAPGGSFASPGSLVTTYNCTDLGQQLLTITVQDAGDPGSASDDCVVSKSILVSCVTPGSGAAGAPSVAGSGGGGAGGAGAGGGGTGGGTGGDGVSGGGIAGSDTGGVSGSGPGPGPVCGDGVPEGDEECDPGPSSSLVCAHNCKWLADPACHACEDGTTSDGVHCFWGQYEPSMNADCSFQGPFDGSVDPTSAAQLLAALDTPEERAACEDLVTCIRETDCAWDPATPGMYDAFRCLCGLGYPNSCLAQTGGGPGACAPAIYAAFGTQDHTLIQQFWTDALYSPGGTAINRFGGCHATDTCRDVCLPPH